MAKSTAVVSDLDERTLDEVEYPESDGEPLAETDTHRDAMADALIYPLKEYFRDRPDVYVSGNLLFYYEEGNPHKSVAPDVFVVFGVPAHTRRVYKLWEEKVAPKVVFELTSTKTRQRDLQDKRFLYEELGVQEYFLFDPLRDYLDPPLQGFHLTEQAYYAPLAPTRLPEGEWSLPSEALGLALHTAGNQLRLYDPARERYLRTHGEEAAERRKSEAALQEAQAEIERLKKLLEEKES